MRQMNMQINIMTVKTNPVRMPSPARADRRRTLAAFTLIEMLTVIAIIGIIAALVLAGAGVAKEKMAKSRARAELDALVTTIDQYHKAKGYYPPDNAVNGVNVDSVKNSLFYELTGNIVNATGDTFTNQVSSETFSTGNITTIFNVGGFLNSAPTAAEAKNYYTAIKGERYALVTYTNGNGTKDNINLFGTGSFGPVMYPRLNGGGNAINPVHYVVTGATNKQGSYDLWFDIITKGKTNRISNWANEPEIVAY